MQAAEAVAAILVYKAQAEGLVTRGCRVRNRSPRYHAWLCSYIVDFDEVKASEVAGYLRVRTEKQMTSASQVLARMEMKEQVEAESVLKAAYVRDYLHQVLEFCPGDAFSPMPGGKWGITKEGYDGLPQKVRRLIISMDVQGEWCSVKFVSKEEALRLAARFTLTQKVEIPRNQVPWEMLAAAATMPREDFLEKMIAEVAHAGSNGNGTH